MDLVASNISMSFDDAGRQVKVLENLDLRVKSGESVAIVGASGVGKTTLLYILGGLEQPASGDVRVGDVSLTELDRNGVDLAEYRGAHIGFVFQSHHLLPEFDAVENVALPLSIRGIPDAEARARASELLKRVGLGERLTHRPGALSGGEQQRVAIARALVTRPDVILADEPTGNLDLITGGKVVQLLLELHREQQISLILVTHSPELASMCDRVVELTPNGLYPFSAGSPT